MRKLYKIIATVPIIATAGMAVYNTQGKKIHLSSIALENVEALADGESDGYKRSCTNGSKVSMDEKKNGATFQMFCNPCGSYGYSFSSSDSKC